MNELLDNRYIVYRNKVREFSENVVKPLAVLQDEKEEFPIDLAYKWGKQVYLELLCPQSMEGKDWITCLIL